jgi:hypothetical protein
MRTTTLLALIVCLLAGAALLPPVAAQSPAGVTLRGTVTDPSGATIPDAVVLLRGAGGDQRTRTNSLGQYSFANLRPGTYTLRVGAKGFAVAERKDLEVNASSAIDMQLTIASEAQVVNVEGEANTVSTDAASNASALVLKEKELDALSDDPDELQQQLQAMAGPGAGPNGGQIYIDGFTGGNLPAKASIREVRINSNPFSPEYDRPGFGRIEIFTKPGTDKLRGQAFMQFNNEFLNSRSPLLTQSDRPPYQQKFFGFNLTGPIKAQKASFGFDFERRAIDENAFILATTLDNNFNLVNLNQVVLTPQTRTHITPRLDYTINASNTLTVRYQNVKLSSENDGIGNFNLASKAYSQTMTEHALQVTETAILSPHAINETRFQYMRSDSANTGDNSVPAINVQGAFNGGGAQIGNSGTLSNHWEMTNITTLTRGTHTFKWGGRLRQSFLDDTSVSNFGGTYTFFGGVGPELDANNQPVAGTSMELLAIERYRRTLLFQQLGYTAAQIRALGGGASQFSLSAGIPLASVNQFDIGLFATDDWRIRPNLTLSYGFRYETQTNISDWKDWSPRVSIAWGLDGGANKAAKTVLRAGFGIFYDRIADTLSLQALRFNGVTQQSYLIQNPDFFPAIPLVSSLQGSAQPQQLQYIYSNIQAPRNYQASVSLERQINRYARISAQYVSTRGVHLLRSRNINAPIDGVYPFGDQQLRILSESTGFSRTNQLIISPNINYKKLFLFGFYAYSHGNTDAEGIPADPYNLRAEWGPSSYADVRHRFIMGTNVPMPLKVSLMPFIVATSGAPYNVTIGRDLNHDGFATERPALLSSLSAGACNGGSLIYEPGYGCFDLNPAAGTPAIGRNFARGPANFMFNMRIARSWGFGNQESASRDDNSGVGPDGDHGPRGGPMGGPRPGGGGPRGGFGGGGPRGMFGGGSSGKKYTLTLSAQIHNLFNHANYAAPSGDLSSPYFGEYRSLAGFGPFGANSTYNRKIDLQLRFTF